MSGNHGNGYRVLLIRGVRGYLENERHRLSYGQVATVGRSRRCPISLAKGRRFGREGRDRACRNTDFLRVSRRHLEIAYPHPDMIEIRNLSRNGTEVNGHVVDRVLLTDLGDQTTVRFGGEEVLELRWEDGQADSRQSTEADEKN